MAKRKDSARLADFQFAGAVPARGVGGKAAPSAAFDLARFDPGAKPFSSGDKAADKAAVQALAVELDISRICSTPTAASSCWSCCRAPTPAARTARSAASSRRRARSACTGRPGRRRRRDERAHDFLWRIHRSAGQRARSRSSTGATTKTCWCRWSAVRCRPTRRCALCADQRLRAPAHRDRHGGRQVHAPHLEGRAAQRLQERLDDPTKHWKFELGDLTRASMGRLPGGLRCGSRPPARPGRRGPSCPPIRRRTAT